ncbi:MAG: carboxylating nicotinate-nucleotide diphosphorylase [Burkholderiales bacterium]|nr:carboxylating nicotinate-nucleotide diphosphorylase [Burkholderiales bacterium]
MIDRLQIQAFVEAALAEDIGFCDLTTELVIPAHATAEFAINARHAMVIAGIDIAAAVFRRYVPECEIRLEVADGARADRGQVLARVTGPARGLLSAERTALNILQHLSGIATLTAQYVDKLAGTRAVLLDTRKTTPGLRILEKHAAQVGGAKNHRLGLADGVMIKDNHIAVCGSIRAAVAQAKKGIPVLTKVEVEADRLDQVAEALEAGADMILLDNMSLDMLREAVRMAAGRVPLEASGGVNLDTIRGIAETGVDYISVGRITQSAPAVDIGLDEVIRV